MTREAALLGLIADLTTDRDALISQREALRAEIVNLRGEIAELLAEIALIDRTPR